MTKQQIIDLLNELTDDPNEEIFGFWDDNAWEIHDISVLIENIYSEAKVAPSYSDPNFRCTERRLTGSYKKVCIDCS